MGVFFRSENLDLVTEDGWRELQALGVRTVVDLRQPVEREQAKYEAPRWITLESVDHDGLVDHPDFWSARRCTTCRTWSNCPNAQQMCSV